MVTGFLDRIVLQFNKRLLILLALLVGLLGWGIGPGIAAGSQLELEGERELITFGVFAYIGEDETRAIYEPIVDYINQQLVYERVQLQVLPMEAIEKGIEDQSLDIITTNPTHFIVIRKDFPLTGVIATLVSIEDGQPISQLGGAIVALSSRNDINNIGDVKGQLIGAPSLNHMGGYRAQAYELYQQGVRLPRDVKGIVELGIHQDVIRALVEEQVDIGFVREGILERMLEDGEIEPGQLKVINAQDHPNFPYLISTQLHPQWPVFALPHVNERAVRNVAAALLSLDPDHPAAQAAGIYGYTIPRDYLVVEELSRTLRIPPFEDAGNFTPVDVWERWRIQLIIGGVGIGVIILLAGSLVVVTRRLHKAHSRSVKAERDSADYAMELEEIYRKLDEEVNKAMTIHMNNLPLALPDIPGLSIIAYYQPANKMGGDYYDVIRVEDKLVFYISDVSGHSLDGAIMSVFVKNTVRNYLDLRNNYQIVPGKIMKYLFEQYNKENYPQDYFLCLFIGVIDLKSNELSYLGCGLQFPGFCYLDGKTVELFGGGLPISSAYDIEMLRLDQETITLINNSTILIYSDGIIEEENNGEQYGSARLEQVLAENHHEPPWVIKEKINHDYREFAGSLEGEDDITFLILQTRDVARV